MERHRAPTFEKCHRKIESKYKLKLKPPPGGDQDDLAPLFREKSRDPSLFTVYDANTQEKLIQSVDLV